MLQSLVSSISHLNQGGIHSSMTSRPVGIVALARFPWCAVALMDDLMEFIKCNGNYHINQALIVLVTAPTPHFANAAEWEGSTKKNPYQNHFYCNWRTPMGVWLRTVCNIPPKCIARKELWL
ncbi:hypothetical protein J437_LFUL011879 [Ladona fulva]|uniref:Uncharacterized protein n=1 Tax=Ladona fulva TaxID=123851 RepID=A0A8K0KCR7_LADFU|nr:hypothetical protein J437_LFUL011879 [Ladona fulva]